MATALKMNIKHIEEKTKNTFSLEQVLLSGIGDLDFIKEWADKTTSREISAYLLKL